MLRQVRQFILGAVALNQMHLPLGSSVKLYTQCDTIIRMLTKAIQESSPALLFTSALSFFEFIEQNQFYARLLRACYAETRLPPEEQLFFTEFPDALNWMVIAAEDAPDTIMVLPVLQRIAEASPRISMHVMCEDDDLSRLEELLEDAELPDDWEELDTPLLLIFDEEWQYQACWGPRPQAAEEKLDKWLEQHPEYEELSNSDDPDALVQYAQLLHKLTYEMRIWYYDRLRKDCAVEIAALLHSIQSENGGDEEAEEEEPSTFDTAPGQSDLDEDEEDDEDAVHGGQNDRRNHPTENRQEGRGSRQDREERRNRRQNGQRTNEKRSPQRRNTDRRGRGGNSE